MLRASLFAFAICAVAGATAATLLAKPAEPEAIALEKALIGSWELTAPAGAAMGGALRFRPNGGLLAIEYRYVNGRIDRIVLTGDYETLEDSRVRLMLRDRFGMETTREADLRIEAESLEIDFGVGSMRYLRS